MSARNAPGSAEFLNFVVVIKFGEWQWDAPCLSTVRKQQNAWVNVRIGKMAGRVQGHCGGKACCAA